MPVPATRPLLAAKLLVHTAPGGWGGAPPPARAAAGRRPSPPLSPQSGARTPIGGWINLAIQDAVAAANLLAEPLRAGHGTTRGLTAVQRRC